MKEIEILQNNKSWIVVNKPAGLSVHNDEDKTNLIKMLEIQGFKNYSAVNRLDKETSGIMILSSDRETSSKLQASLADKLTSKKYLAIVKGTFTKDKYNGTWNQELTNRAEGRNNPLGIKSERVKCITHFKVLKTTKYLSFMQFKIETGRQHQIRKHCIIQKHQIVGDSRYGDKKFNSLIKKKYSFTKMALHSYKLRFSFENLEHSFVSTPPSSWKALDVYDKECLTL